MEPAALEVAPVAPPEADVAGTAPPPTAAPKRRGAWPWVVLALVVLIVLGAGGGAFYANDVLNQAYSPERAVLDYFAAQARGDVDGMIANATFDPPDGSYAQFFDREGVAQMMRLGENKDISHVRITSLKRLDVSSATATVAMTWHGAEWTGVYAVRRDTSRVHYLFYPSWRIAIPYTTVTVTLPNQPGLVLVDSVAWPTGAAAGTLQVIAGYHALEMLATPFWVSQTLIANGVSDQAKVRFDPKLSSQATTAAAAAVKAALGNCDVVKFNTCPGHTYQSAGAPGTIYFFPDLPGYGEVDYNSYVFNLTGDMTADMQLVVTAEPGRVTASGSCTETMTVDGSRNYTFKGSWTGILTWAGSAFSASIKENCHSSRA